MIYKLELRICHLSWFPCEFFRIFFLTKAMVSNIVHQSSLYSTEERPETLVNACRNGNRAVFRNLFINICQLINYLIQWFEIKPKSQYGFWNNIIKMENVKHFLYAHNNNIAQLIAQDKSCIASERYSFRYVLRDEF